MRDNKEYPWIVVRGEGNLVCDRCGDENHPPMPINLKVYLVKMDDFIGRHSKCKEKKNVPATEQ